MAWLLRKSATLIAVYSIALQALIWGFVPAGHFGLDPFAIICTTGGSGDHQPAPGEDRGGCGGCLPACGSSAARGPGHPSFSVFFLSYPPTRVANLVEPLSLQPRHQPQASRAPPIPS